MAKEVPKHELCSGLIEGSQVEISEMHTLWGHSMTQDSSSQYLLSHNQDPRIRV